MSQSVDEAIRPLRVVTGAVGAGLLAFTGMAVLLRGGFANGLDADRRTALLVGLVSVVGICAAAAALLERAAVAQLARRASDLRNAEDPSELAIGPYRQLSIVGAGMIEAPAFFGVVVYLLTGSRLGLLIVGVGVALLVVRLPSRSGLQRLIERAMRG